MVKEKTNPTNLQCCCSTEAETGFVPISAQFFAVGTFLILRSPYWTRSCIQKYRVSMCFVRCPAPNRTVKECRPSNCHFVFQFSLELLDLGTYIDLRDSPT